MKGIEDNSPLTNAHLSLPAVMPYDDDDDDIISNYLPNLPVPNPFPPRVTLNPPEEQDFRKESFQNAFRATTSKSRAVTVKAA
eukprot:3524460-Amphidinium_carterae.1